MGVCPSITMLCFRFPANNVLYLLVAEIHDIHTEIHDIQREPEECDYMPVRFSNVGLGHVT